MDAKYDYAISTTNLTKRYTQSTNVALSKLNLGVKWGEVYGFLGPNGAGKSTAIRLMMNFLKPTSGSVMLSDQQVGHDASIYKKIGYLSGDFTAYPKLTGKDFLDYMQALSNSADNSIINKLTKKLDIDLSKKIGTLSKGNRQKIGLIQAFMHSPQILILDEPTTGLDPLKQEVFYELVLNAKNDGACIFISSHNLSEVQKICDRIGIIRNGKLVHECTIADLELEASQRFEITFINKAPTEKLQRMPGISSASLKNPFTIIISYQGELSPLLKFLSKYQIKHLETSELDLEAKFMHYYNKENK